MPDGRAVYSCAFLAAVLLPVLSLSGGVPSHPAVSAQTPKGERAVAVRSMSPAAGFADAASSAASQVRETVESPAHSEPAPESAVVATVPAKAVPEPAKAEENRHLLEDSQMVVFYGSPLHAGLGILGMFEPDDAAARVKQQAAVYDQINGDRGAFGAMDLIYGMVMDEPTGNGLYLRYLKDDKVEEYLKYAEEHDLQLILDLQIGRSTLIDEVRKIERFLENPRIHVAIDPEYAVGPYGVPIHTAGVITGHELNEVQRYLADLVQSRGLPPKMLVVHQYLNGTIVEGDATEKVEEVDLVLNMDAFGPVKEKRERYFSFAERPYAQRDSFNIFLKQDERVMSEQEVLDLSPPPDAVFYQ